MADPIAKACPFCGEDNSYVECIDFGGFAVICNGCLATGPQGEGDGCDPEAERRRGRRNAIRAWNRRSKKAARAEIPPRKARRRRAT